MWTLNLQVSKLILISLLFSRLWCTQESEKENDSSAPESIMANKNSNDGLSTISSQNKSIQTKLDSLSIINFLTRHPESNKLKKEIFSFYQQRGYSYAWLNQNGIAEHTFALYNKVLYLIDNGIPYNAPYVDQFKLIMENRTSNGIKDETEKELLISCQYLYYIDNNINTNIPDRDIDSLSWYILKKRINPERFYAKLLADSLDNNDELYPQYYKLLESFRIYSTAKKSGKWNSIQTQKKQFKLLDSSAEIKQIRQNLFLLGDLSNNSGNSIYDNDMAIGVNSFQQRHGLKKQDLIESRFIKLMNVPLEDRIEQILLNMERCKWLPNETSSEYLIINIPQFSLQVYASDSLVFTSNVVVGKETNPTMIFKGDMKYVIFSPYWNVPESILKKEILPAIEKNPNYLEKNNMEWYNGSVRQLPGGRNALGRVKFIFPNSFNIYLHDTPSKNLFNLDKRTFSHGCIRVSEPMKLAKFLLRNDKTWDEPKISEAMLSEKETTVKLEKAVPVYVVYFTSFVDQAGKLNFREDIYGRDKPLKEILFNKK